jgi:hypothetical protein
VPGGNINEKKIIIARGESHKKLLQGKNKTRPYCRNINLFTLINLKIKETIVSDNTDEHYSKFLIQLDIITQKDNFLFPENQHKKCKIPRVFVTQALLSVLFHILLILFLREKIRKFITKAATLTKSVNSYPRKLTSWSCQSNYLPHIPCG